MTDDKYLELDFRHDASAFDMDRRQFLKVAGSGIFVLFSVRNPWVLSQEERRRRSLPEDFNAFLRIGEDGRVTLFTGKIEMGQGVITSLPQMLADELYVQLNMVDIVLGDTDLCPWDMGTFGSRTTRFFGPPLRAAAAEARRVLLELAAEKLDAPVGRLATADGWVYVTHDTAKKVSYAQLTRGKRIERHMKEPVAVKDPSEFKVMGNPLLRRDSREKVTGEAKYAGDIQLPGMLYARILRPPAHDAKLASVDLSAAEKVPGAKVIRDGDLIAVLHERPDMAEQALAKIEAKFDTPEPKLNEDNIFDHLLKVAPAGEQVAAGGDLALGEKATTSHVEMTYLDGYVAHAPIEPHTAVVRIEDQKVTVWPSSQTPFPAQEAVAQALQLPLERVRVISPFVGGGFGGKTRNQQVVEAARLAKLSGRSVQVAWSRAEEFFYDSFRPAAVVKIRSGLNEKGEITYWDYHVYFAGERGSPHFYEIPHHLTLAHGSGWRGTPGSHPFATGAWRAPGNNTNTFARESHVDMLAAAAKTDPVEFRLKHLKDEKMRRVLQTAAIHFGWTPAPAPSRRGCGVACGIDAGTSVATIAEVEVDRSSGAVSVKRVVAAQDMGLSVNPQGATIQMEGCIMMGLGYALTEDIRFRGGRILDLNFDTYEIPRFSWLPRIETVIIDDPTAPAQGGGEPAIITMGGAIANAIYDAVGARVIQLPMTPARVKQALSDS